MSDDLISREALKNYARKVMYENNTTNFSLLKVFDEIIDNAPTVETCANCEDRLQAEYIRHSSSWNELQELRKFKAEYERPQGEWIMVKENNISMNCFRCTNCNFIMNNSCYNYCPNCGAYMRKEAEHDSN